MLARRRFMGCGESCPYQRIEYLEANEEGGPARINTGFYPEGEDLVFTIDFTLLGVSNIYSVIFSETSAQNLYRIIQWGSSLIANYGTVDGYGGVICETSTLINKRFNAELSKDKCVLGEKVIALQKGECGRSTAPLCIFDRNSGDRQTFGRLHSFRISENGVSVLDLIPVRVGDEGFMYDKVSGRLLGNSGSGRFILGPDLA